MRRVLLSALEVRNKETGEVVARGFEIRTIFLKKVESEAEK